MEKQRLNLFLSKELIERLENCAKRYGVSRVQLAVMLIGQGLAGIEEAFRVSESVKDIVSGVIVENLPEDGKNNPTK